MPGVYEPGTILFGKYRVENVLGRGGMGLVLRVTHIHLGEDLAIKVLLPEFVAAPDVLARFLREAQSVVRLRGEHVARVSDVGVMPDGSPYMMMEYLRGIDLAGELQRRSMLAPGEAVDYVLQACEALAEAHAHQIVHRDIKPANLFLTTRPDGTPLIKVLDFGISKAPTSRTLLTKTDTVLGTPGYMSPEQMKATKEVDGRTDIWSLGVVLYQCLNGRCPFESESFSAMVLLAATEPAPAMDPRVPRGLQAVVLRCLEKERDRRYPSIAALAAALAPFARDHRAAAITVERTRLMHQGVKSPVEAAAHAGRTQPATTVSGSAGVKSGPVPRGYVIAGAATVAIAIAAIVMVVIQRPPSRRGGSEAAQIASSDAGLAAHDHPGSDDGGAPPVPAAGPSPVVIKTDDPEVPEVTRKCIEAQAARDWQGLVDCAEKLDALGAQAKATELRAHAVREQDNELRAQAVSQALREKNLKDAETVLAKIGDGSVYHKALSDQLVRAEAPLLERQLRKAQGYAANHDCVGLRQWKAQAAAMTTRIFNEVQSVQCTERPPPSAPVAPAALPPPPPGCASMNVDDLLTVAANQSRAGYARPALAVVLKVLPCRQDTQIYRFAVRYACDAKDAAVAKQYFPKIPPQFQAGAEQSCQQNGIGLR
jgi:Protein kinase domain